LKIFPILVENVYTRFVFIDGQRSLVLKNPPQGWNLNLTGIFTYYGAFCKSLKILPILVENVYTRFVFIDGQRSLFLKNPPQGWNLNLTGIFTCYGAYPPQGWNLNLSGIFTCYGAFCTYLMTTSFLYKFFEMCLKLGNIFDKLIILVSFTLFSNYLVHYP